MKELSSQISTSSVIDCDLTAKTLTLDQAAERFRLSFDGGGATPRRPTQIYKQNEWIYIGVNKLINAARSIQMMLSTAHDDIIESGPAYDLFFNSALPFTRFITETVGFYSLFKTCYWIFRDQVGRRPTRIEVAGPTQVQPLLWGEEHVGWELTGLNGRKERLALDEVWAVIDFNPYDLTNTVGVGVAQAGKLAISSSYQASLYNEAVLANGGSPGVVISYPVGVKLDADEIKLLRSQYEHRHGGAANAGKVAITTQGAEIKSVAQTMAELQMLDLRMFDGKVIAMLLDVPPEVMGIESEAQYAHGPAQQRFIINSVGSLLGHIADHINTGILSRFTGAQRGVSLAAANGYGGRAKNIKLFSGYRGGRIKALQSQREMFAWFALEEHPTVQEMLRERAEKVLKYTQSGVALNQVIDAYDLPFDTSKMPWGDHHWIGMGQVPADWVLDAGPDAIADTPYPGDEDDETEKPAKRLAAAKETDAAGAEPLDEKTLNWWKGWVKSWRPLEQGYERAVRMTFVRQARDLKAKLKQAWNAGKGLKADGDAIIARVVFDLKKEDGKIRVINRTFFEQASELGVRQGLTETLSLNREEFEKQVAAALQRPALQQKLKVSTAKLANVNRINQERVTRTLQEGLDKGDGLQQLADRIDAVLGDSRARALGIARTQTAGALNSGRMEGFRQSGIDGKSWVTAGDELVRPAHRAAGQRYAKGIPLEQPFEVDGEALMYPGEPGGSPGNVINCRCTQIALRLLSLNSFDIAKLKIYTYEDMTRAKAV